MERAPVQRRQGWLNPALGATALVLFGIAVGRFAFPGARAVSPRVETTSSEIGTAEPRAATQMLNVVNRTEIDPELLREQVTKAVGEALDARAAASPTAATSAQPALEQPLTAKNIEAFDAAQGVLARGVASHRWTRTSRQEFVRALAGATNEQRKQMQMDLVKRFNSGEVQYEPEME